VFAIKSLRSSGGCVAVERQYLREFSDRVAPSRDTVSYMRVCVCDKRAKGRKCSACVRKEAVVGAAREVITGRPKKKRVCDV
jgi:hypothetical protein